MKVHMKLEEHESRGGEQRKKEKYKKYNVPYIAGLCEDDFLQEQNL